MYYLRSRPAADAIKFTLDVESMVKEGVANEKENDLKAERLLASKENVLEEMPVQKKIKTEMISSKKKTVCGDDICYSCGS